MLNNRSLINVQRSGSFVPGERSGGSRAGRMCYKLTMRQETIEDFFRFVRSFAFIPFSDLVI